MRPKTYQQTLKKIFSSPRYYLEVIEAPFGFSFRFFVISLAILGFGLALRVNLRLVPLVENHLIATLDEAVVGYPDDLKLSWDKNILKSSSTDTITIPYPSLFEKEADLPPTLGYYVPTNISPTQFLEELTTESLFVVSDQVFFINNLQGGWDKIPLTELLPNSSLSLDKNTAGILASQTKMELSKALSFFKKIDLIIIPIGFVMIKLWMSVVEAVLLFLFIRLNRINLKFRQVVKFSLHLMVVAETINQVSRWLYPNSQIMMTDLAYWSVFIYVFWTQKKHFLKLKLKK